MASLPPWVAPRHQAVFVQGLSDQQFVSIEGANNLRAVWRVGKALDPWTDRVERPIYIGSEGVRGFDAALAPYLFGTSWRPSPRCTHPGDL